MFALATELFHNKNFEPFTETYICATFDYLAICARYAILDNTYFYHISAAYGGIDYFCNFASYTCEPYNILLQSFHPFQNNTKFLNFLEEYEFQSLSRSPERITLSTAG